MQHRAARTKFQTWCSSYGATRLARIVGERCYGAPLSAASVRHWISGRHVPRAQVAQEIVRLSGGAISFTDIYSDAEGKR